MFEGFKNKVNQFQLMQKMMKDDNFKAFISHPKVQEVMKDPDVQQLIKSQDMSKVAAHPKFMSLMQDPEVGPLLSRIDPKKFMSG